MITIVTKNESELWEMRMTAVIVLALCVWGGFYACDIKITMLLIIFYIPLVLVTLYHETWRLTFSDKHIHLRVFFFSTSYTYSELCSAELLDSYTLERHVRLHFSDGKKVIFRMRDVNAQKAVNKISKHRSIKDVRGRK